MLDIQSFIFVSDKINSYHPVEVLIISLHIMYVLWLYYIWSNNLKHSYKLFYEITKIDLGENLKCLTVYFDLKLTKKFKLLTDFVNNFDNWIILF